MDFSNLFSHPYEPEIVSSGDASTGAVEHPTFSDRPEANAPVGTTPSS
jgi:hypothetical protein